MPFGRAKKQPAPLNESGLYNYAVKALGRRMRTEMELRRLMKARMEHDTDGDALITSVTARLKEHGYLNDQSFAETYARLRQENEKFGQRRVRQDLQQKGIPKDVITEAVDARYGQTDEEALARQHLERKRVRKPANEKETTRILRRLIAAGFSTGVIYKVLRKWDVPDESLAALETIDDEPREE